MIYECSKLALEKFSIEKLHDSQEQVLSFIFENSCVLATLPTGSGKTLLYTLPALIFESGPVIVVSPLISLIRDQSIRMEEARIKCAFLTSDQSDEERRGMWHKIKEQDTKLIFCSPERFVLSSFHSMFIKNKPSMVVIDEAHCVVSWGHQFRPEYFELRKYLEIIQPQKILALTATASKQTRSEIIRRVFPENRSVIEYVSFPVAKNILVKSFRQFSMDEQSEKLIDLLEKTQSKKCIVYFSTRKQCDDFSKKLIKNKINAVVYHAGIEKNTRLSTEKYIRSTDSKVVICATTAFGLGINIQDIQLVIVYGFPANIEEFFQMIGRAGRSGAKAEGVLLWTGSDPIRRKYQLQRLFPASSIFLELCRKISCFMPKDVHYSCFILNSQLEEFLKKNSEKNKKTISVESILGGLRACHCIDEISPGENYYQITLSKNKSFAQIVTHLPDTLTKRKIVLDSVKTLLHKEVWNNNQAQCVLSESKIVESSGLEKSVIENVFSFYATQNDLTFDRIPSHTAMLGIILKNGFNYLVKNLENYTCARNNFLSSLNELEKLATAISCRLMSSTRYFALRPISGAYIEEKFCLQCDLCQKSGRINK